MFVLVGAPFDSRRDTVAQLLQQAPELHALGLPNTGSVLQADTLESPNFKPFIVVRWGEQEQRMGGAIVQSFDLWVYDEFGDYNRPTAIAKAAADFLVENGIQVQTTSGHISQIEDRGIGGDLADDGFDAVVIPYHLAAIGRGL